MTDDKELLVALWTIQNLPPLPKLPNFHCYECEKEIFVKPVFFQRAWACHPGKCIKSARRKYPSFTVGERDTP